MDTKKSSFYLVVDDCGMPTIGAPIFSKQRIGMGHYQVIVDLAKEFGITVMLAFSTAWLNSTNKEYQQTYEWNNILRLLDKNREYWELAFHGWDHSANGTQTEFYDLEHDQRIDYDVQETHFGMGMEMLKKSGLGPTKYFVPPGHAWELGVTDKIAEKFGIKYMVTNFKTMENTYQYSSKSYVKLLNREGVGINYNEEQLDLNPPKRRIKHWSFPVTPQFASSLVHTRPLHLRLMKMELKPKHLHSYMAHIGNFDPESRQFWRQFFRGLKRREIHLCRSAAEATKQFLGGE
ncbi:MAG TPA: DUF2334 domain-containing protein [Patescibacteria group bacterium]|nr:DUF2334 domain-containing protein [Patescibacteria group bacterium]